MNIKYIGCYSARLVLLAISPELANFSGRRAGVETCLEELYASFSAMAVRQALLIAGFLAGARGQQGCADVVNGAITITDVQIADVRHANAPPRTKKRHSPVSLFGEYKALRCAVAGSMHSKVASRSRP